MGFETLNTCPGLPLHIPSLSSLASSSVYLVLVISLASSISIKSLKCGGGGQLSASLASGGGGGGRCEPGCSRPDDEQTKPRPGRS
jgi:hypothetical protein